MMKFIRNAFILINFIALCCAAPWERYEADIRTVYNIDLLQSPQEAASNICGELDYECLAGAMKTYQNQKLMFVEEVHKEYSAHKNESGSIATVLYSSFIIDKITLPSTVCMFGDVHIQFVLYVLMYCKHCGIIVGNQSHAVSRWTLYMHLFPHANVQLFFEGKDDKGSVNCDVVYLAPDLNLIFSSVDQIPLVTPSRQAEGSGGFVLISESITHFAPGAWDMYGQYVHLLESPALGVSADLVLQSWAYKHTDVFISKDWRGFLSRQITPMHPLDVVRYYVYKVVESGHVFDEEGGVCQSVKSVMQKDDDGSMSQIKTEIYITYNNPVFYDTAIGTRQALLRLNRPHTSVVIASDGYLMSRSDGDKDMEFSGPLGCANLNLLRVQIVLGAHEDTLLLPNFIAFHMEQSWSIATTDLKNLVVLQGSSAIWSFSETVATYLDSEVMRTNKSIEVVPVFFDETSILSDQDIIAHMENNSFARYNFTFFGSHSDRRKKIFTSCIDDVSDALEGQALSGGGFYGGILPMISGRARDNLVFNSKIIINIHLHDDSALEVHRLNYLLSRGACVVSERSSDPALDAQYEEAVVFADLENFSKVILELLKDDPWRQSIKLHALEFARRFVRNVTVLDDALLKATFAL